MKTPPMVKRKIKTKTALTLSWRGKFLLSAFWVNWVLTQRGYPQSRTCKKQLRIFIFFYATFFSYEL